uniref:Uncharacterized protein n=1 Tax=Clandestinovirus TaxID=2831644 RepID=A0A8F8KPS0_9VIRU|nr:hypothetical protein KOM_12_543 [Clandestinovirus]
MECTFRVDYPNTESSESEMMDSSSSSASEDYEEVSDSSSEESVSDNESSSESQEESSEESDQDEDDQEPMEESEIDDTIDELYVQSVAILIHDVDYAGGDYCGKLIVPIKSIEAVISIPDDDGCCTPDEDGEYQYKILLRSGKELTTFCKCPPTAFRTYLFDVTTYYQKFAKRYGDDPYY